MVFARKRFGQNFLQDPRIINQIVDFLQAKPQDNVIEIGPGRGALTTVLLSQLQQLTVIEIDRDLFAQLKNLPNSHKLTGINEDVLKVNFEELGTHLRIIGNLPYNISTPLMFHLLKYRHQIDDMVFMLQSEVVDKIIAQPASSDYGRLSVMFQYFCEVERLLDVPPECFNPVPKVMSAVISLKPKHQKEAVNFEILEQVVAKAFAMRRKTLANNFKGVFSQKDWELLGLSSQMRAQDLSIEDFVKIAEYFSKIV
jgi:16S rRNA (adenine1518-N6/adenine1519-N6)-dimethyltransferase